MDDFVDMNDSKVYANNKCNLKVLLDIVEIYTNDISINFGVDKCNVINIIRFGHRSSAILEDHI